MNRAKTDTELVVWDRYHPPGTSCGARPPLDEATQPAFPRPSASPPTAWAGLYQATAQGRVPTSHQPQQSPSSGPGRTGPTEPAFRRRSDRRIDHKAPWHQDSRQRGFAEVSP